MSTPTPTFAARIRGRASNRFRFFDTRCVCVLNRENALGPEAAAHPLTTDQQRAGPRLLG